MTKNSEVIFYLLRDAIISDDYETRIRQAYEAMREALDAVQSLAAQVRQATSPRSDQRAISEAHRSELSTASQRVSEAHRKVHLLKYLAKKEALDGLRRRASAEGRLHDFAILSEAIEVLGYRDPDAVEPEERYPWRVLRWWAFAQRASQIVLLVLAACVLLAIIRYSAVL